MQLKSRTQRRSTMAQTSCSHPALTRTWRSDDEPAARDLDLFDFDGFSARSANPLFDEEEAEEEEADGCDGEIDSKGALPEWTHPPQAVRRVRRNLAVACFCAAISSFLLVACALVGYITWLMMAAHSSG
jgi:hypothetical protein